MVIGVSAVLHCRLRKSALQETTTTTNVIINAYKFNVEQGLVIPVRVVRMKN